MSKPKAPLEVLVGRVRQLPEGAARLRAGAEAITSILEEIGMLESLLWELRGYLELRARME